jgi:membrane protease YdiL (CAAX protease family)
MLNASAGLAAELAPVSSRHMKGQMIMATITHTRPAPADSGIKRIIVGHPLTAYFVLAFGLMWVFALPLALSRNQGSGVLPYDLSDTLGNVLFLLATFSGPTVAALIVTGMTEGRAGVRRLLKRCVQWRVQPSWYLVALGINMLIWLLAYTALIGPQLLVAAVAHWPLLLSTFLPLVAFGIIIPSIAEEPGWRGFALPRLQQRHGPVVASLLLGALHGLWHLPGLMTVNFGPLPLANYLPFMITAAFGTVIYTWVYNQTGGSILLVILLHAASNAASQWLGALLQEAGLLEPTAGLAGYLAATGWINVIAYGLAALLLIAATRRRLGYRPGEGLTPDRALVSGQQ